MIRVKAAFFSFTPPAAPDDDGSYLQWHLLDHQPEQYQLPGIQYALRYIADGEYPGHNVAANDHLSDVGNLVNYLVGEPVQQTYDDFLELGPRLADMGRFPQRRGLLQLRMPALLYWYSSPAARVSAEVVPFRPHRGVLAIVEEPTGRKLDSAAWLEWTQLEHYPAVLATPGVAGVWVYGESDYWVQHPRTQGPPQYTTIIYLDEDPLATTKVLRPLVEDRWASGAVRPLFAGPLRTMIQWEAWT